MQVITVNQVVDILVGWLDCRDWAAVLDKVLPGRKRDESQQDKGHVTNPVDNQPQDSDEKGQAGSKRSIGTSGGAWVASDGQGGHARGFRSHGSDGERGEDGVGVEVAAGGGGVLEQGGSPGEEDLRGKRPVAALGDDRVSSQDAKAARLE